MLVMLKENQICSILLINKMLDKQWISECFHTRSWSMFCDVRVSYKFVAVGVKAMDTTRQHILLESLLSDV